MLHPPSAGSGRAGKSLRVFRQFLWLKAGSGKVALSHPTHQSRFKKAAYVKVAAKTDSLYAELAAQLHKPAYNIALSDWFDGPVIHEVNRQDGRISIDVTDNVKVASVRVTILDDQGESQGQGQAVRIKDDRWEYETSARGNILVEAFDLPGNVTRHEA